MSGDSSGDVGPDAAHAAIVVCCILGLVVVAGVLPAVDAVGEGGADDADAPWAPDAPEGDEGDGAGSDETATSPDVSVSGATPGTRMVVRVTDGRDAVSDVPVIVDGERVGTTNETGRVDADVPYEDEITVTAEGDGWSESVSRDLTTDVDVEPVVVDADDRRMVVEATLDGRRVSDAAVLVDGERRATTDGEGRATIPLPGERVDVAAERGAAGGETTVDAASLDVDVGNYLIAPVLPGGPATATVTVDDVPVRDAPVIVDGERVATTNDRGRASFRLPLADAATVGTDVGGLSDAVELEGLAFKLAWTVLGLLSVAIGLTVTYLRAFSLQARRRHRRLFGDIVWRGGIVGALRSALGGLRRLCSISIRAPAAAIPRLSAGLGWLSQFTATLRLPRLSLAGLSGLLSGATLLSALPTFDRGSRSLSESDDERPDEPDVTDPDPVDPGEPDADDDPPLTVHRAWHELVDRLGVVRRETHTPGQIARRAVEAGYPDDAVVRLTAAFRDVEYGGREQTRERLREVAEALERIRGDDDR